MEKRLVNPLCCTPVICRYGAPYKSCFSSFHAYISPGITRLLHYTTCKKTVYYLPEKEWHGDVDSNCFLFLWELGNIKTRVSALEEIEGIRKACFLFLFNELFAASREEFKISRYFTQIQSLLWVFPSVVEPTLHLYYIWSDLMFGMVNLQRWSSCDCQSPSNAEQC